jgi:CubicO group peptidase (beta-lactamase class C family)
MWAGLGGTSFTIDPKEKIVGVFMAQAPTPRLHTRFLFKNLLYGALVK